MRHITIFISLALFILTSSQTGCVKEEECYEHLDSKAVALTDVWNTQFIYSFDNGFTSHGGSTASETTCEDAYKVLEVFENAFTPYFDIDFIRNELNKVFIVEDLHWYNGQKIKGVSIGDGEIAIDANQPNANVYLFVLLHEFFHVIHSNHWSLDFRINWSDAMGGYHYIGYENTASATSENGYPCHEFGESGYCLGEEDLLSKGFIRDHGERSFREDFATYCEALFLMPEALEEWSLKYPIVKQKRQLCIDYLSSVGVVLK